MTFKQWLANKIVGKKFTPTQGVITDDMREQALAVRRQEHALKQKEKEVAMMERILSIENGGNPKSSWEENLIKELLPVLMEKLRGEQAIKAPIEATAEINLSEVEIKSMLKENPKLKAYSGKFTDEQIKEYIIQQMPKISKSSVEKIILEVRQ